MRLDQFKIREYMARERLASQRDLAEAVGVSYNTITSWVRGVNFPQQAKLVALCSALNCGPEDIIVFDEGKVLAPLGMRSLMLA